MFVSLGVKFKLYIQRNSFNNFLKNGLMEELQRLEKIVYNGLQITFQPTKLKYKSPRFSPELCLIKNKTYSIRLYVPIQVKYHDLVLINCGFKFL